MVALPFAAIPFDTAKKAFITPLRRRMTEDMQVRNPSPSAQRSYIDQVARFAQHFHQSPDKRGPEHIRDYQVFLATCYAAGLRISEAVRLRPRDIDSRLIGSAR